MFLNGSHVCFMPKAFPLDKEFHLIVTLGLAPRLMRQNFFHLKFLPCPQSSLPVFDLQIILLTLLLPSQHQRLQ